MRNLLYFYTENVKRRSRKSQDYQKNGHTTSLKQLQKFLQHWQYESMFCLLQNNSLHSFDKPYDIRTTSSYVIIWSSRGNWTWPQSHLLGPWFPWCSCKSGVLLRTNTIMPTRKGFLSTILYTTLFYKKTDNPYSCINLSRALQWVHNDSCQKRPRKVVPIQNLLAFLQEATCKALYNLPS